MNDPSGAQPPDLTAGAQIGRYRIEALIGEGGMGQVFRAVEPAGGLTVALKVMKERFPADSEWVRRFLREARAASEISHPNLVGVLDAGEQDGRHFLVMPFVAGQTVDDRIRAEGFLTVEVTQRMVAEVAAGLDALHSHGLVHRDVKPSNIIFASDGSATLADFGLAKGTGYSDLTRPGQVVGTVDYLAPELIRGEPAAAASDLYALGCVVYESLSGAPPFGSRGRLEVGMAHLEETPSDPCADRDDVPGRYGQVVCQALAKDPSRRPATASDYARSLAAALAAGEEHSAGAAYLVVIDGDLAGRRVPIAEELTVGREDADLALPDPDASRRHALLRRIGGGVEIEDEGSLNGTWVEGRRAEGPTGLADGSRVRIGSTTLLVELGGVKPAITRVSATSGGRVPEPAGPAAPPGAALGPLTPFSPAARAPARGAASRLWVPAAVTFAVVIATAIALLVYFASR